MSLRHRRRSLRLKEYDYTQPGAYFVTMCTQGRELLFGHVIDGIMNLNQVGQVQAIGTALPKRFPSVELDHFRVMPNHVHGIINLNACLYGTEGAASRAPTSLPRLPTLGDVVGAYKSVSTVEVNRLLGRSGRPLWQRNYYEHIVRDQRSLAEIRVYIVDNPARWAFDRENPEAI